MALHDKHQYFYEKYLRNEMPDNERQAFEEKLSADDIFRKSFQYYRANRGRLLKELVEEDDREGGQWKIHSWIYLLISSIGLVLVIHYFTSREPGVAATTAHSQKPGLLDRINIFKTEPAGRPVPASPPHKKRDNLPAADSAVAVPGETPLGDEDAASDHEGVMKDVMLADTFLTAYDKEFFDLRYRAIRSETDSILNDSALELLAMKSSARNTERSKPVTVFVEFWESPVHFKGYRFTGKKLIVYGIRGPFEVYLLQRGDALFLHADRQEIALVKDDDFHKF